MRWLQPSGPGRRCCTLRGHPGRLIQLMVDQVNGEFDYGLAPGWVSDLLTLAHQGRAIYLRHPWLLDLTRPDTHLGPRALDYLERSLAVMDEVARERPGQLQKSIGLVNGMVRQLVGAEVRRQHDGQSLAQWQVSLAAYLAEVGGSRRPPARGCRHRGGRTGCPDVTGGPPVRPCRDRAPHRPAAHLDARGDCGRRPARVGYRSARRATGRSTQSATYRRKPPATPPSQTRWSKVRQLGHLATASCPRAPTACRRSGRRRASPPRGG